MACLSSDGGGSTGESAYRSRPWRFALLLVIAVLLSMLWLTSSSQAALGVRAYWGSDDQGIDKAGGKFGENAPAGLDVYEQTGDVYVADADNNRVQQFDADGRFIRAWGFDVSAPAAQPASSAVFEICDDPGQCKVGVDSGVSPTNGLGGQLSDPTGLAVDQGNGHVYVVNAGMFRIEEFTPSGAFVRAFGLNVVASGSQQADELQRLTVAADSGQYKLKFGADSTGDIDWNEPAASIQAKLNLLGSVSSGGGSVVVTGGPGGTGGATPYLIEFTGALADANQPAIEVVAGTTALDGTATVSTVNEGAVGYEICTAAANCRAGTQGDTGGALGGGSATAGLTLISADSVASNSGNLLLADANNRRVQEFTPAGEFVRIFGWDVVSSGPGDRDFTAGPDRADEVQTLVIRATSGNFRLRIGSGGAGVSETVELPYNATPQQFEDALNAITNINSGGGSVSVTGGPGDASGSAPYVVTFDGGANAGSNVRQIVALDVSLEGGLWAPAVLSYTNLVGGQGFEVCRDIAGDICKVGTSGAGHGQFTSGTPTSVAQDADGVIYTAEERGSMAPVASTDDGAVRTEGFRVQKFAQAGDDIQPQGEWLCDELCGSQSLLPSPSAVATDDQGFVYVVRKFAEGSGDPPAIRPPRYPDFLSHSQDRVLKIDPAGNAGAGQIVEVINVNTSEEPRTEGSSLSRSQISGVSAIAPTSTGKPLYLATTFNRADIQAGASRVFRFDEITPPSGSISTSSVGATAATLRATVTPAQTVGRVKTLYRVEYRRQGALGWTATPSEDAGIGNGSAGGESDSCSSQNQASTCHLDIQVDGLTVGRTYEYRLVARTTYNGSRLVTEPKEFTTAAVAPSVATGSAVWSGPPASNPSLTFNGKVNPQGARTTFTFEYVSAAEFAASGFTNARSAPAAPKDAGHGPTTLVVTAVAAGLDPDSAYRFRLVARNAAGTTTGGESLAEPSLAGDRFIELVSAGDSQGGHVNRQITTADDGERVGFSSVVFGDQEAAPWIVTAAIAQRGPGGWTARAVMGDPVGGAGTLSASGGVGDAAVSRRLWQTFPVAGSMQWSVRGLDGALTPISPVISPLDRSGNFDLDYQGASPDLSTVVFSGGGSTLFPGEPLLSGGRSNLYAVYDAGSENPVLRQVNRGPGGESIGGACGATLGAAGADIRYRAVSVDGSVVYFSTRPGAPASSCDSTGTGQTTAGSTSITVSSGSFSVGQSISATHFFTGANLLPAGTSITAIAGQTITISAPALVSSGFLPANLAATSPVRIVKREGSSPAVELPVCARTPATACDSGGDDLYVGASGDGSKAFFLTRRALADSDADTTDDLYLYDASPPAGQPNVVQASAGDLVPGENPGDPAAHQVGEGAEVLGVVDISMDGSRAYFVAKGRLTSAGVHGGNNLYVFERSDQHPAGRISFVATLAAGVPTAQSRNDPRLWQRGDNTTGGLRPAYALPRVDGDGDGRFLVFVSNQRLLPAEDQDSESDVYRYDDQSGDIACISCAGNGAFPAGIIGRWVGSGNADQEQSQRVASDDGSKVVFTTSEQLLPADANQVPDAYLWDEGRLSLVSGVSGDAGIEVSVDAGNRNGPAISPDGASVFFVTTATLLPQDTDNGAADIYAARVDGGFAQQESATACVNVNACRGVSSTGPPGPLVSSASVGADGNLPTPRAIVLRVARRKAVAGPVARLRVRVPAAGRLRVSGAAVRRVARRAPKAGGYTLRVVLKPRARRRLMRSRGRRANTRLKARVRVSFRSREGQVASKALRLTFRPVKKAGGR